jgi:putative phosphoesterase
MQVSVLYAIPGNRVALSSVLQDIPTVDRLVFAGDVVGYNPWHADCVDAVRGQTDSLPDGVPWPGTEIPTVMGNHDRAVAATTPFAFNGMAQAGVEHAREQLSQEQLDWLAALPEERRVCGGRVKLVHGHPDDPDHYTYPDEFGPELVGDEDVLVMGHTHRQYHEVYDDGIAMNPGSVGQPRDGDHRAAYAVLDLDDMAVEERRVEYSTSDVIQAVDDADLPREIGFRLTQGR